MKSLIFFQSGECFAIMCRSGRRAYAEGCYRILKSTLLFHYCRNLVDFEDKKIYVFCRFYIGPYEWMPTSWVLAMAGRENIADFNFLEHYKRVFDFFEKGFHDFQKEE